MIMVSTTNQKLTLETASAENSIPDVKSRDFSSKWVRAINSIFTNSNLLINTSNFDFKDMKMERKFMHEYHHWGANSKIMDETNKSDNCPETYRLVMKRQEITKPEKLWFRIHGNLNRKMWLPRRPGRRRRDVMASSYLELLFRNNEKNRWGGGCFEINEPSAGTRTERKKQEPENVSSTAKCDVVRPTANFSIVELKKYDIADKTTHYVQLNHLIE